MKPVYNQVIFLRVLCSCLQQIVWKQTEDTVTEIKHVIVTYIIAANSSYCACLNIPNTLKCKVGILV